MPVKTVRQAINESLRDEMRRDPTVIVIGEDVSGGTGCEGKQDSWGGPMGVTKGLFTEFGSSRVIDTPISESAFVGAGAGAACTGLRPVIDIMFIDLICVCYDQIFNQMAKFRYMFGGKSSAPLVIRAMVGAGFRAGAQHSNMLHPLVTMVPGLKVVMPSNAYDAKGLLLSSIRDEDPVVFLEHKTLYDHSCEVPDGDYIIPFGEANFLREGNDLTVIAVSGMVPKAIKVVDKLAKEGISVDLIDPRTVSPLDDEAIIESVEVTGRLVIIDEASPRCGLAGDIASIVAERAFSALKAPIRKITPPHTPVPYAPLLEDMYIPSEDHIERVIREVIGY